VDVSTIYQRPVQHLEVSTTQGPELHLAMSGKQEPLPFLDVSTLQGHELHLNVPRTASRIVYSIETCAPYKRVFTLGPKMHLDVSSVYKTWSCDALGRVYRSLSCT
jgi:hypothetical protein